MATREVTVEDWGGTIWARCETLEEAGRAQAKVVLHTTIECSACGCGTGFCPACVREMGEMVARRLA